MVISVSMAHQVSNLVPASSAAIGVDDIKVRDGVFVFDRDYLLVLKSIIGISTLGCIYKDMAAVWQKHDSRIPAN